MVLEKRSCLRRPELRGEDAGDRRLEGYGAVFYDGTPGTEYKLWDNTVERVMPGAFRRAIDEDDVRSLFNHDANIVLGRNQANPATLRIVEDEVGLAYVVDLPNTQLVRDLVISPIERRDVSGSSFMFRATKAPWVEEDIDVEHSVSPGRKGPSCLLRR